MRLWQFSLGSKLRNFKIKLEGPPWEFKINLGIRCTNFYIVITKGKILKWIDYSFLGKAKTLDNQEYKGEKY